MALLRVDNVSIRGISAAVPRNKQHVSETNLFNSEEDLNKFISGTGVENRRIADENTTTADLCFVAAEEIISTLNWSKNDIDCLIFVSQTPEYTLPATSVILHERLKLNEEAIALDISLGCSGWVYGLYVISNLISTGQLKKGLLLVGDTVSKLCSTKDKSTFPLFGDAGTATAIEYDPTGEGFKFHLATDGSGADAIKVKDGGFRNQFSADSLNEKEYEGGIIHADKDLTLDGMNVFSFGITKAPESVNKLIDFYSIDKEQVDLYLFHQANKFMNEKIRKKIGLPQEKVPYTLSQFGNSSSASIPLTFVSALRNLPVESELQLIACGFGVGLSWGSVWFRANSVLCPEIIEI